MDAREQAERYPIVRCRTGSHAYGMATASSDLDVRGVFAGMPLSVMSPFFPVELYEVPGEDTVLYELSKYVKLVCDQNPNIVELLWVDESDVLFRSPAWKALHDMRAGLLTTRIRATYAGYAMQALKKMRSRSRWMEFPEPAEPPRAADFVALVHDIALPAGSAGLVPAGGDWAAVACGKDVFMLYPGGSAPWLDRAGHVAPIPREEAAKVVDLRRPAAIVRFAREEYDARKKDHANYWTWRRERDGARGAVEERLGYDPKNGAHLIRLMRTAREALREGVVRVRRPDAAELLAIRRGEYSYERVVGMAEEIDAGLAADEAASPLPRSLDLVRVAETVMRMYETAWRMPAVPPSHVARERAPADSRRRVVVLDIEGTGHAEGPGGRVVEIAAVEIMGGIRTGRVFHAYVDPETRVGHFATRIHGLTNRFLRGKPVFADVAGPLLAFIGSSPVVAHNAAADMKMLGHDLERAGLPRLDGASVHCTERMSRQLFPAANLSLDRMCDALAVDRTARERGHGALVDASLAADCLLAMAELPGYAALKRTGLDARAMAEPRPARTAARNTVSLSGDGATALFTLPDGTVAEAPVPPHPDTHRAVAHRTGSLLIVRRDPRDRGGAGKWGRPENPEGPAVVLYRDGAVKEVWFEGGRPVPAPGVRTGP